MSSRVLRATPSKSSSVVAARRFMHASAVRADLVQDIYTSEIKAFKPKTLTDKDAEGSVSKWSIPSTPKVPTEEVSVSGIDEYAQAPVEIETAAPEAVAEASEAEPVGDDWFPIESYDKLDGGH